MYRYFAGLQCRPLSGLKNGTDTVGVWSVPICSPRTTVSWVLRKGTPPSQVGTGDWRYSETLACISGPTRIVIRRAWSTRGGCPNSLVDAAIACQMPLVVIPQVLTRSPGRH